MRILRELAASAERSEEEGGFGLTFQIQITICVYKCQANLWIFTQKQGLGTGDGAQVEWVFVC